MINLNTIKHMDIKSIVALPLHELDTIRLQIEAMLEDLKSSKEILDTALEVRFSGKTSDLLAASGRDSGAVNFEEDDYLVSAQLPKKVTWNQDKLATLVSNLPIEDQTKYIETTYKINETRYLTYWPLPLRIMFDDAREVTTGKLKLTLKTK